MTTLVPTLNMPPQQEDDGTVLLSSFITERYELSPYFTQRLYNRKVNWGFGLFSEVVYYDKYSRIKPDGTQEHWPDTVIRVVNGVMSIRKDHYKKNGIAWEETYWNHVAEEMAENIFEMKFLPPGRGLFAMGTDYVYTRGSMALNNCAYVSFNNNLAGPACWGMDALMCGVGVGFGLDSLHFGYAWRPLNENRIYVITDNREGWVKSVRLLIDSYFKPNQQRWVFDYSHIRPKGSPLKGFGGKASGPDPLIKLHGRLRKYLSAFADGKVSQTRLAADVVNAIGACVVAGNIRRSAEILLGSLEDDEFLHLKDYKQSPERSDIAWMSNNSVILKESKEFESLPVISDLIRDNGEPGIINRINVQKYGRVGKKMEDYATGFNPCAEIPLESHELCNLSEVFPMRCDDVIDLWRVMELATIYASTVSLLPTHSPESNAVIAKNRRIGVSVSGVADWIDSTSVSHVTMALREGYEKHVEPINRRLAREAIVAPSIRLTTVKPSGTISLLAGASPGMHWPVDTYVIRRMRVSMDSPLLPVLVTNGFVGEKDVYSDNTWVYSFPLQAGNGKTRSLKYVSLWEQAMTVIMLQREWADNAVSNTLTFQPHEANQVEHVIAFAAPLVKSISMLPSSHDYEQAPYESITETQYEDMFAKMPIIDWSNFHSDGQDEQFCGNDSCEIPVFISDGN